jgi:Fe-S-cluster containining protein
LSSDLDCLTCGACCREAYHAVELHPNDRFARRHPDRVGRQDGRLVVPRTAANWCSCLGPDYRCAVYDDRPRTCRDFEKGGEHCREARRRVGLDR